MVKFPSHRRISLYILIINSQTRSLAASLQAVNNSYTINLYFKIWNTIWFNYLSHQYCHIHHCHHRPHFPHHRHRPPELIDCVVSWRDGELVSGDPWEGAYVIQCAGCRGGLRLRLCLHCLAGVCSHYFAALLFFVEGCLRTLDTLRLALQGSFHHSSLQRGLLCTVVQLYTTRLKMDLHPSLALLC